MKRNWYKIEVGRKTFVIKRIIEVLFKYGYVYDPLNRIKDYPTFCRLCSLDEQSKMEYITIGQDEECNHVMGNISYFDYYSYKQKFIDVTLEEFLKINGYVTVTITKPKDEQLVMAF